MLKEHASFFRRLMIGTDASIAAATFFMAHDLGSHIHKLFPLWSYVWIMPIYVVVWVSLLYQLGLYSSFRVRTTSDMGVIVGKAAAIGFIILTSFVYLTKSEYISRTFLISTFSCTGMAICLEKAILLQFFRTSRRRGYNFRSILIVGAGKRAQRFIDVVNEHAEWGLKVIGLVDERGPSDERKPLNGRYPVLGSLGEISKVIRQHVVDDVVFVVPRSWLGKIDEAMRYCEMAGLKVSVAVDFFDLKLSKAKQTDLNGYPLLTFESAPDNLWLLFAKRLSDTAASLAALVLLSPVFLFIAIAIKVSSRGPVLFRQVRCGLNGRQFTLYKFRTMVSNAEERLEQLRVHNEMEGPVFKMSNDPRVTAVGRFLRKWSMDELPQLWNVLAGDMSLVGPRPPLPSEVEQYDHWQRRKLSMRPGVTCLWQINGRNDISNFNDWVKLDLSYIDNWSLWLDYKILLKTIPAVFSGAGAR